MEGSKEMVAKVLLLQHSRAGMVTVLTNCVYSIMTQKALLSDGNVVYIANNDHH